MGKCINACPILTMQSQNRKYETLYHVMFISFVLRHKLVLSDDLIAFLVEDKCDRKH